MDPLRSHGKMWRFYPSSSAWIFQVLLPL